MSMKILFENMVDKAIESGQDETDVYAELLEMGVTPKKLKKCIGPSAADHMELYCKDHGLL